MFYGCNTCKKLTILWDEIYNTHNNENIKILKADVSANPCNLIFIIYIFIKI